MDRAGYLQQRQSRLRHGDGRNLHSLSAHARQPGDHRAHVVRRLYLVHPELRRCDRPDRDRNGDLYDGDTLGFGGTPVSIATQPTVTVTAFGTANQLVFTTQPVGGVPENMNLSTQPMVKVEDQYGNVVTTDNGSVTLGISSYTAG